MKKILYLSRSGQFGGMEKHILDLINSVKQDYQVHVFCPDGYMAKEYLRAGAVVRFVFPTNSFDLSYARKVREYVINNNINIVHGHELEVSVLGLISIANLNQVKKIMHVHTPITSWKHSFIGKLYKSPLNFIANFIVGNFIADKVIALTVPIAKERVRKELIKSSKVIIIPNSISISDFQIDEQTQHIYKTEILNKYQIAPNKIIIGNLSRLTREKGQDTLIKAFANISKTNKNLHLLIAGGGELLTEYKNLIEALNIKNRCTITGIFKEEEKVKLYSTFDYFVFPSLAEGFGYVLVEAMGSGLPILSSNIDVLKDVSKGLVEFFQVNNANDLADKLSTIIHHNYDRKDLYKKYKKVLDNYSFTSFKHNYLSLYNSLL